MCHHKELAWFPLHDFRHLSKDNEEVEQWQQNPLETLAPWGGNLYCEIWISSDLLMHNFLTEAEKAG